MLVLSRKTGERIHIGDDVFVEVRRVSGNRVTLAINAPREVRILRGELMDTANAFEVLEEEPMVDESAKDTVVIKNIQAEPGVSVPAAPIIGPIETAQIVRAK